MSHASVECMRSPNRANTPWASPTYRGYPVPQAAVTVVRLEWTWTPPP